MHSLKHIERLHQLHKRIKAENTGSPAALSKQLGVSERSLYYLIDMIKDMKVAVRYSRKRNTYFYENTKDFDINVYMKIEIIHKGITKNIYGGRSLPKNNSFTARKLQ